MADDKKFTLLMHIKANGTAAMQELRKLGLQAEHFGQTARKAGNFAASGLSLAGKGFGLVTAPLEIAGKGALALGAGFVAMAAKSVLAAGDVETLRLRLESIVGSQEEAAKIFDESRGLAGGTLFDDDSLVEARIKLIQMGMAGKDSLQTVIDTASATGKSLEEVVGLLSTAQSRGLKRFGIDAGKDGDDFTMTYRDRLGKVKTLTAETAEEARKNLASIFQEKFSGSGSRVGNSMTGAAAAFKRAIDDASKSFGAGLLPAATAFVNNLAGKMDAYIESGKLQEMGARVGDALSQAIDIGQQLIGDPEKLRQVLNAAMQFAADAFVTYLVAAKDVFVSVAKIMSAAFLETILASDIPGTGAIRMSMWRGKHAEDYKTKGSDELAPMVDAFKMLSPADQAAYVTQGKEALFREGLAGLPSAFNTASDSLQASAQARFGGLGLSARSESPALAGRRDAFASIPNDLAFLRSQDSGQGGAGGITINGNVTIRADNPEQISRDIRRRAGQPQLAVAGY